MTTFLWQEDHEGKTMYSDNVSIGLKVIFLELPTSHSLIPPAISGTSLNLRLRCTHGLVNYIDDNAFLNYLLAPQERKTQDVFSGIVDSFAHHSAICK
jgi:hypothetical protein